MLEFRKHKKGKIDSSVIHRLLCCFGRRGVGKGDTLDYAVAITDKSSLLFMHINTLVIHTYGKDSLYN